MAPTVSLDEGTFTGSSSASTESFGYTIRRTSVCTKFLSRFSTHALFYNSIGDRRHRLPVPIAPYTGTHNATSFGLSGLMVPRPLAPQGLPAETIAYLNSVRAITFDPDGGSEDCLTINVMRPAGTTDKEKLPVAVWIYGGAFQTGSSRFYDGTVIVDKSIQLDSPVIYVSFNYRLNGFGILGGKEMQEAGVTNIALHDQREALRWVQKYIHAFGGDPGRVVIWGESAGAISVGMQMVAKDGDTEGLFHGAFMESGSPVPAKDQSGSQPFFDNIVKGTGCADAKDKVAALRALPVDKLKPIIDTTPLLVERGLWLPRADGTFLTDNPQLLVKEGKIARIPFVTGVTDDEGTLFALRIENVTTDADFAQWIRSQYFPDLSDSDIAKLMELYPSDITQGSPFDTGTANAITPQYKRLSAFLGDVWFDGPRRFLLQQTAGKQKSWSYLSKRGKNIPIVGAAHTTEIPNVYGGQDMTDYLIQFVNTLNPNGKSGIPWPLYDVAKPDVLTFLDGDVPLVITQDTYRKEAMAFLSQVAFEHRL